MKYPFFTCASNKELKILEPDNEDVPLSEYRAQEIQKIIDAKKQVVIVGSVSGVGRSHMAKTLFDRGYADVVFGPCSSASPLFERCNGEDGERAENLVVDEIMYEYERVDIPERVKEYCDLYKKVVLMSGGCSYTPMEEAERVFEYLGCEDVDTVIIELKLLSKGQVEKLISSVVGRYNMEAALHPESVKDQKLQVPYDCKMEKIVDLYLPEFRLIRLVATSVVSILRGIAPVMFRENAPGFGSEYVPSALLEAQSDCYEEYYKETRA